MKWAWIVFFGAGIGGVLRMFIQRKFAGSLGFFPWGTLAVNLAGGFFAGVLSSKSQHYEIWVMPLLMTGFLGGFTTFSAFSVESLNMIQAGDLMKAGLYSGVSVVGAVLFCMLGVWLAKFI